jgi:uncharacterized protein
MRTMLVVAMGLAICLNGWVAYGQEDARRALAEELLNEMNMKENVEKSAEMIKKMIPMQASRMRQGMKKNESPSDAPKPTDEAMEKALAKVTDMVTQEMSWDKLKEDYITVYAEIFTADELKGAIAFFKSPAGKAFTKKQPELMQRSMEVSKKQMSRVMPTIMNTMKELQQEQPLEGGIQAPQLKKAAPAVQPQKEGE